ncbi:MAG: hypothetical protein ACQEXC_09550 [Pseudomonadota bacterium]
MPLVKTFIIKNRGRKYFDCVTGKYKAKLLINDVSNELETGRAVQLYVTDLSDASKYGTVLKFEPLAFLDACEPEEVDKLYFSETRVKQAIKWLEYAENDALKGMYQTKAIKEALNLCMGISSLSQRISALKNKIKINSEWHEAKKWLEYAEGDAKAGMISTKAINKAFDLCPKFEDLTDRLAALKQVIEANGGGFDDDIGLYF